MDYEKKYNEALEDMRVIYPNLKGDAKLAVEHAFPELRESESEDERIRKWLADYFSSIKKTVWIHRDITCEQILEWLEKQKENPKNAISIPADCATNAKCPYKIHGDEDFIGDIKDTPAYHFGFDEGVRSEREKQKEQKPAEWSEVELEFRGEKVKVKRPFYRDDKGRGYSTAELDEEVAWNALRAWCEKKGISLYDLYPKAEWSEEDADILNCCISSIEEAKENRYAYKETDGDTSYDHEIAWLKSLRPSWKPSGQDELMKLKYAGTSTKLD